MNFKMSQCLASKKAKSYGFVLVSISYGEQVLEEDELDCFRRSSKAADRRNVFHRHVRWALARRDIEAKNLESSVSAQDITSTLRIVCFVEQFVLFHLIFSRRG